jgi:hypothetical protein
MICQETRTRNSLRCYPHGFRFRSGTQKQPQAAFRIYHAVRFRRVIVFMLFWQPALRDAADAGIKVTGSGRTGILGGFS